LATRIVTVDIDSNAIRLLQLQGNRVERWATTSLEAGVVEGGTIADPQALAAQIRRLRRSSGITGGEVVAGVSGLFSVARTMKLPPESQERLLELARETVPDEALRPLWQTIRTGGAGQEILFVWANEQQVDTYLGTLRAAGMAPRVLEFKTMALYRAVDRSSALIVNMEPSSLDLVLIADGLPQVMRTIALPGTPSAEERVSRVAQALEHTIAYYDSRHEKSLSPPNLPLFLVGPMAEDTSLRQQIEERVGYPLESFAPPLEFPSHLPVAQYAVNMGLALRQVARPEGNNQEERALPVRINLVPRSNPFWRLTRQRAAFLGALAVGIVIAYLLFQLSASAGQEVARLEAAVRAMDQEVKLKQDQGKQLTQVKADIQDFANLTPPLGRVTAAMDVIEESLIPGVRLNTVNIGGGTAAFSVSAETVDDAIQFVKTLRADGRFGAVPFTSPTKDIAATLNLATLQNE